MLSYPNARKLPYVYRRYIINVSKFQAGNTSNLVTSKIEKGKDDHRAIDTNSFGTCSLHSRPLSTYTSHCDAHTSTWNLKFMYVFLLNPESILYRLNVQLE